MVSRMDMKSEKGQAMVEFALVLPFLILLFCFIIDAGWLFSNQITVNNACREAARYTAIHFNDSTVNDDALDAETVVKNEAPSLSSPVVTLTNPGSGSAEIHVTVSVPVLTGVTSTVLGKSSVEINADSVMKIEQ
jgi:Flp pilus assembly protein TadG